MHEETKTLMRLDCALRSRGAFSREEARDRIRQGRIAVEGVIAESGAMRIQDDAMITADGIPVPYAPPITLILNKVSGTVSVTQSPSPRYPTVFSFLPEPYHSMPLFAIGRLDADAEGLLLLTTDGALCRRIAMPEAEIPKTYFVRWNGTLDPEAEARLLDGVLLSDGRKTKPARLERLSENTGLITVTEGRYHEVKRLVRACGGTVTRLVRRSIGGLSLDDTLAPGQCRPVTEEELSRVFSPAPQDHSGNRA